MSGVGGDGYWLHTDENAIYVVVFDCIGHGRLASIMTRVYLNAIKTTIGEEKHDGNPAVLLISIHQKIKDVFKDKRSMVVGSGADVGIFKYQLTKREVSFAGAGMGLVYVQDGKIHRLKGNKRRVGDHFELARKFDLEKIDFNKKFPISFYMFTDGLPDLIGGPENKRFGFKNLGPLLVKAHTMPIDKARKMVDSVIQKWLGGDIPLDDLLIIGFTI